MSDSSKVSEHYHDCGRGDGCRCGGHQVDSLPASSTSRSDGLASTAVPTGFSTEEAIVPRNDPETYYSLELYYEYLPPWSIETVGTLLRERNPSIRIHGRSTSTTFLFEFPNHRITSRGGGENANGGVDGGTGMGTGGANETTAICCLARSAAPPDPERLWEPLRQTWGWAGAGEALARCRGSILLTDLVPPNGTINPIERVKLLQSVLVAFLDSAKVGMPAPLAIHWVPSKQFVSPEEFLAAYRSSNGFVGIPGPINVRVLPEDTADSGENGEKEGSNRANTENTVEKKESSARVRLDTLGLAALGFADFQIDATGLAVSEVVRVLYNTALYVLERGAVIRDGHTIPGLTSQQKWPCRIDVSWMTPRRTVLTIEPAESNEPAE